MQNARIQMQVQEVKKLRTPSKLLIFHTTFERRKDMFVYALEIEDTGQEILREETDRSMVGWQKITEKRLLRRKRTPAVVREAILNNKTVVGWANYDALRLENVDMRSLAKRVFKGYDKYYEDRKNGCS